MTPPRRRPSAVRLLGALLLPLLLAAAPAAAREGPEPPGAVPDAAVRWLPEGTLYSPYTAEIRRPGFGVTTVAVIDEGVEDAGALRLGLKLGGRFALLRFAPRRAREAARAGRPAGRLWQLDLDAGFYGQFDVERSLDNIGWDGLYALLLTSAAADGRGPAYKVGLQHVSAHVGDEYAERTGRRRIGYTREEVVAGVAVPAGRLWRLYGEAAWAHVNRAENELGEDLQQPGRVQAGVEVASPGSLGKGSRWGWYAAFDANAYEERDWQPDLTLGAGFRAETGDRAWRLGLALYDGKVPLGEYFQVDERYALLGAWLDLEKAPLLGRR